MKKSRMERHLWFQRSVAILFGIIILLAIYGNRQSAVAQSISLGQRVPVLLFGVDAADASRHTDTLMLSVLDSLSRNLNVISIPRDTRIHLKGYRFRRINEVYGYHLRKTKDRHEAAISVIHALEEVLSGEEYKIDLPYYFQVDYSGFKNIVDILGGVWVRIKHPMHYDDNAGNYHFHMEPGRYLMNGDQALKYVRFRGASGDRGRIFRQQEFLRNMAKRMANPVVIFRAPQLFRAISASIETNLSVWDVIYLAAGSRRLRSQSLGFYILPGVPRGPYWKLKTESVENLTRNLILGEKLEIDPEMTIASMNKIITVKVWNASTQRGLAYRLTKSLRQNGFDVVDWGNYPQTQIPTRVIDRVGVLANAEKVAEILGVENTHSEVNFKSLVDVEVVLGENYSGMDSEEE